MTPHELAAAQALVQQIVTARRDLENVRDAWAATAHMPTFRAGQERLIALLDEVEGVISDLLAHVAAQQREIERERAIRVKLREWLAQRSVDLGLGPGHSEFTHCARRALKQLDRLEAALGGPDGAGGTP